MDIKLIRIYMNKLIGEMDKESLVKILIKEFEAKPDFEVFAMYKRIIEEHKHLDN